MNTAWMCRYLKRPPSKRSEGGTLRSARGSRHAFTLVELLTVVAIIGILAGVLMVGLSKVRETSRRTTCGNNVRTLTQALLLYASDNRGKFPNDRPDSASWPYAGDWAVKYSDFFESYVSDKKSYFCPTGLNDFPNSEPAKCEPYFPEPAEGVWRTNISYVYFFPGNAYTDQHKKVLDITVPARTTMLADFMKLGASIPNLDTPINATSWNHQGATYRQSGGHLGYMDGHVVWFSLANGLPAKFATKSGSRYYVGEHP